MLHPCEHGCSRSLGLDALNKTNYHKKTKKERANPSYNLTFYLLLSSCSIRHRHSQSGDQGPQFLKSYLLPLIFFVTSISSLARCGSFGMDADDLTMMDAQLFKMADLNTFSWRNDTGIQTSDMTTMDSNTRFFVFKHMTKNTSRSSSPIN